jgi:hypothetical protein
MSTITKHVKITLEDALWQALHDWTDLIRRDARARGLKEGVREETVVSNIIRMALLDNSNELCARLEAARLDRLEQKGLLGLVRSEAAEAAVPMDHGTATTDDW